MKTIKNIFTLVLFIATLQAPKAQQDMALENSTLWKVEHSTLEKPSYLLGTLHMMCASDFQIPEKVNIAMTAVDALVVEINLSDSAEIQKMQASMAATKKISEELSPSQFEQLDTLVQRIVGTPLANLDAYGLQVLSSIMISKMLPCTDIKLFEAELMQIAKTNTIPIHAFETIEEQMAIVKEAYPLESSYEQLMLHDSYERDFNKAITAYNNEKLTEAVSYLSKPEYMDENATLLMQVKRNQNWVEQMPKMMEKGSNLFAVGAAHLTDEFGLIHLLREKGYTVSPVLN
ncbi:hypothetical protein SAMN05661096_03825 [Marivirga sericea]|uniref:TraB family protein n=1 Tax=Marivirga sericea TaxID=1028 RepID=A0A1X7LF20_9BACT|nr:TraB/GumN family protein [Marivirga sericea]SMG51852.1 hypothetical protein SAMN05661096_03825 [Marivirga sericea]